MISIISADRNHIYNEGILANPRLDNIDNLATFDEEKDAYDCTNFIYKHQIEASKNPSDYGYLLAHVQTTMIYNIYGYIRYYVLTSCLIHDFEKNNKDISKINVTEGNFEKWDIAKFKRFYTEIRNARLMSQFFQDKMSQFIGYEDTTDAIVPIISWFFATVIFNQKFYKKGTQFEKFTMLRYTADQIENSEFNEFYNLCYEAAAKECIIYWLGDIHYPTPKILKELSDGVFFTTRPTQHVHVPNKVIDYANYPPPIISIPKPFKMPATTVEEKSENIPPLPVEAQF